ncbi:MAG: hypothetical protein HY825_13550 [Acidobacteria bacterium]|nr:hypothetical protein [Acidobacteriota bacterium]
MRKTFALTVATLLLASFAAAQYPAAPAPSSFAPAWGKTSRVFVVDPANGSDSNSCISFASPCAGLAAAYAKTVSGRNDTVLLVGGATATNPTATITWANSYTHLVGLTGDLPGMGQRARIVGTSANALTEVITFSGSGCIVKNIQVFNGASTAIDAGAATVSGSRNYFENVFWAGMGDATALGPATRAGGYSLKVTGSENMFVSNTIGLDTVVRSAANYELAVSGSRNSFRDSLILSNSVTSGKFLVQIDNSAGDLRYTTFTRVLFHNYTENWASGISNAFDMPAGGSTHYVILDDCQLVGVGSGWADTVTHVYLDGAQPNAGAGISTNPTT